MNNSTVSIYNSSLPSHVAVYFLMSSCVVCVASNVFVIYLIARVRRLKTVTNIFVCSICLCNIMFALILLPAHCFHGEDIVFDFIAGITILVYICNLTAASYDRLLSITQPMHYGVKLTKKKARLIVLVMWLLPIAYNLIPLSWILTTRNDSNIFMTADDVYRLLTLVVFLLCPLLFILFVYLKVSIEMKRMHDFEGHALTPAYYQKKNRDRSDTQFTMIEVGPKGREIVKVENVVGEMRDELETLPKINNRLPKHGEVVKPNSSLMISSETQHRESTSNKPTRRLARRVNTNRKSNSSILKKKAQELKKSFAFLIVAMTYMFTWLPVMVLTFLYVLGQPPNPHLITISQYAIALNALADPFLYGLLLPNFRKTLKIMFKRLVGHSIW